MPITHSYVTSSNTGVRWIGRDRATHRYRYRDRTDVRPQDENVLSGRGSEVCRSGTGAVGRA